MTIPVYKRRRDWTGIGVLLMVIVVLVVLTAGATWRAWNDMHNPDAQLRIAIQFNSLGAVKAALQAGANVRGAQDMIMAAVVRLNPTSDSAILNLLIQQGLDINRPLKGHTPLRIAVAYGNLNMALMLLQKGARIPPDSPGDPPLLLDALQRDTNGKGDLVCALLDKGVNPNVAGSGNPMQPVVMPDGSFVLYPAAPNGGKQTPLDLAVSMKQSRACKKLLQKGAVLSKSAGRELLLNSIMAGQVDFVTLALAHGADPNSVDGRGTSALSNAAGKNNLEMTTLLLTHGANPNAKISNAPSARPILYDAVLNDNPKMVRLLLAHGANARNALDLIAIAHAHSRDDIAHILKGR